MGRARHQRDAGPGRDHVKLLHSSWRAAGARGRRRGEGGAAGACLDAARRAGGKSHGEKGGGVHRWPPDPLGQLWRAPRRQAVRRQAHRHRAAEADHPLPARRRGCRASTSRTRRAENTCTCSTCACPTCCTAAWCGRAASAPTATAPSRSPSTRARLRAVPAPASCARATSSASSRARSGTRSRPRRRSR